MLKYLGNCLDNMKFLNYFRLAISLWTNSCCINNSAYQFTIKQIDQNSKTYQNFALNNTQI